MNIINLETSLTTHNQRWPNKVFKYIISRMLSLEYLRFFSYRTHPANVACLTTANIHHVSLANNHTLDFGVKGLEETCETLDKSGISYVG